MFQNLYKQNFSKCERQDIRRKFLLQQQKLKRSEEQDLRRHSEEIGHYVRREKSCPKKCKSSVLENIQLQSSEWLKEKPDTFNDWLMVPCPKGQRCLVVAEKGKTKMYSKSKKCLMTFSSLLPGSALNGSFNDYSILDCIFSQKNNTFYVLDALHFAIPLIECDAEFRFFWLKSKFNEIDLHNCKSDDLKTFELLDNYDMSNFELLAQALHKFPLWPDNQPQLDGFLFYHKESHYVFGNTPLVCWLFPFMLPNVLQIAVCTAYSPPANYSHQNPWKYMDEFDEEMKRKRNKTINRKELLLDFSFADNMEVGENPLDD